MEVDILLDGVREELRGIVDNVYTSGMNFVLEILKDEIKNPSCLSCEYCVFVKDNEVWGGRVHPFLANCLNKDNEKNPKFKELWDDYDGEFEIKAPIICGNHKFSFEKFKQYCEIAER
jgi:hypothetical protein